MLASRHLLKNLNRECMLVDCLVFTLLATPAHGFLCMKPGTAVPEDTDILRVPVVDAMYASSLKVCNVRSGRFSAHLQTPCLPPTVCHQYY